LADPTLQLFDGTGKTLFINDNWKDTQQAGIQATGLAAQRFGVGYPHRFATGELHSRSIRQE